MTQLSMCLLALQAHSKFHEQYATGQLKKADYWKVVLDDSLTLIAQIPMVAAHIYRRVFHDGVVPEPKADRDWAGNYADMLGCAVAGKEEAFREVTRLYLMLHADHEGGNVSSHVTHTCGSALSDPFLAWAAGVGAVFVCCKLETEKKNWVPRFWNCVESLGCGGLGKLGGIGELCLWRRLPSMFVAVRIERENGRLAPLVPPAERRHRAWISCGLLQESADLGDLSRVPRTCHDAKSGALVSSQNAHIRSINNPRSAGRPQMDRFESPCLVSAYINLDGISA